MIISHQAISFSHVAYVINKISSRAQHMNQPEQEEKHTHTQTNSFCGSVCRHFLASFAMCVLYFRLLNSKPNCKNMQAQLSFFVCTVAKSHFHVLEQWNWSMPFYFSWSHLNVRSLVWCFFFLLFSSMHFVCYFSFSRNRKPEFISLAIFRDTSVTVCLCTRVSLCHTASVCIFLIGQRHKKCSEITTQLSFWIKLNGICFGRTSKRKPEKRHTLTRRWRRRRRQQQPRNEMNREKEIHTASSTTTWCQAKQNKTQREL